MTSQPKHDTTRKPWLPMNLRYTGDIERLVQRGRGKLSAVGGDPGEPRKQKPIG